MNKTVEIIENPSNSRITFKVYPSEYQFEDVRHTKANSEYFINCNFDTRDGIVYFRGQKLKKISVSNMVDDEVVVERSIYKYVPLGLMYDRVTNDKSIVNGISWFNGTSKGVSPTNFKEEWFGGGIEVAAASGYVLQKPTDGVEVSMNISKPYKIIWKSE